MTDETWPYYIDDPLVDRAAHRLSFHSDETADPVRTPGYVFGECSCGEWTTPTWDLHGVMEAFDWHMGQVQAAAHAAQRPPAG